MARTDDWGRLILRAALGILVLLHGVHKLFDFGGTVESMGGLLASQGLPAMLAYGVFFGEVVGPLLVLIGFYARAGAVLIAVNMLFAFMLVHMGAIGQIDEGTGGWLLELQGMYFFAAVALTLIGPGRFGINRY